MTEQPNDLIKLASDADVELIEGRPVEKKERPKINRGGRYWRSKLEAAMAHQGYWVEILAHGNPTGAYTRYRLYIQNRETWVPNGFWKMRTRSGVEDGDRIVSKLWVMYVRPEDKPIIDGGSRGPMRGIDMPESAQVRLQRERHGTDLPPNFVDGPTPEQLEAERAYFAANPPVGLLPATPPTT